MAKRRQKSKELKSGIEHPKLIERIYLCGPLENVSESEAMDWRETTESELRLKGGVLSYIPGFDTTENDPKTITILDFMMIDKSQAVLANLTFLGKGITATGSIGELGYARAKGKLIVAYTTRKWKKENRFVKGIVDKIFDNREEAVAYIIGFNRRKKHE